MPWTWCVKAVSTSTEHFAIPPDTMLPEMLTDKALEWYRNNRALWYSWDDFVEEFRDFYLPNYEEVLEDQIVNRCQRPGEADQDFVQAIPIAHSPWQLQEHRRVVGNRLPRSENRPSTAPP